MATECTQESVLDFLLENGGRVKNKDLVAHFKVFLGSENTKRAVLKERFKRFVDNIAYVKQENGEKVVCLKKKYRYPEMRGGRAQEENEDEDDEGINRAISALHLEKSLGVHDEISERGKLERDAEEELRVSDIALIEKDNESERGNDVTSLSDAQSTGEEESRAGEAEVGRASVAPQVAVSRRRTSRGSQRSLLGSSEDAAHEAHNEEGSTPKGSRKNFIELMMSSSPQVRRSLVHRHSQGQLSARAWSADEDLVTLDPLEHEWMMCTADGEWDSLQRLLECEPTLISKKDFVTGFTCLHWAAKQGKHELLAALVGFAKRHGVAVNVNGRSSAGYAPLHLAAMHHHVEVMKLLVGAFDADVEVRDYSGKKAAQYLRSSAACDIKDIIGAGASPDAENASGSRWKLPRVLQTNLNPLRLLNGPEEPAADAQHRPRSLYRRASIGRIRLQRNRFKTQIVHSTSFRENDEGETLKSPVKSRPVSNLFG
ncbi:ankyrin repeat domain-containing protein SOWAHC [Puntigrus tetrazona]|uniref:ankyrin repeat domain-containing protein SOWAHC n=1 Tax=Puntigrus tetrazona TaxID=1606681 RepID=UPI001C89EB71|nr:ankyrin repeat domain-containing protein SOWAHC [Puntigrus tetrazona]